MKLTKKINLEKNSTSDKDLRKQFSYEEELVKESLKEFNFINFYKGWIPERFNEVKDNKFIFVHVDVDLYEPTKNCIDFFFPRLINGGIMVFDDYGYILQFPGAKLAIDERLSNLSYQHFIALPSGQAYLIK